MFYRKTIKFWNERINACWNAFTQQQEANKNMAKQIEKAMQALEKTVYPGINETREELLKDRVAINKIIAKVWHKKEKK